MRNVLLAIMVAANWFILHALITGPIGQAAQWPPVAAYVLDVVVLGAVMGGALTDAGEWVIAKLGFGGRKASQREREFLMPLLQQVADAAAVDASGLHLYISDNPLPNAFAVGSHGIVIQTGLLRMSSEAVAGVLAHEFGHLKLGHTRLTAVALGANAVGLIVLIVSTLVNLAISIVKNMDSSGFMAIVGVVLQVFGWVILGLLWVYKLVERLLMAALSRVNEYEADEFAAKLGFAYGLTEALETLKPLTAQAGNGAGLGAILQESHPATELRIDRLLQLAEVSA